MSKDKGYEVGYGKPPKKNQFQKGMSGNPTGRKKGTSSFFTLTQAELDELITINSSGEKITKKEAIVKKWIVDAARGNSKAREQVLAMFAHEFEEEKLRAEARKKAKLDQIDNSFNNFTDEQLDGIIKILNSIGAEVNKEETSDE